MALLCDADDVAIRLGRLLTQDESVRVDGLIAEASVHSIAFMGRDWVALADVPEAVRIVCSRVVARTLAGASAGAAMMPGLESYSTSMGPLAHSARFGPEATHHGTPTLTNVDRAALRPLAFARAVTNWPAYAELE